MPAVMQDRSYCPSTNSSAQQLLQTMTTFQATGPGANIDNNTSTTTKTTTTTTTTTTTNYNKNKFSNNNIIKIGSNSQDIMINEGRSSDKLVHEVEPLDVSKFSAIGGLYGSAARHLPKSTLPANERHLPLFYEGGYQNLSINDGTMTPVNTCDSTTNSVVINLFGAGGGSNGNLSDQDTSSSRRLSTTSSWLIPILSNNGPNNFINSYKYPLDVDLSIMKKVPSNQLTSGKPGSNGLPIIYGGHGGHSGSGNTNGITNNVSMFWTTVQVMIAVLLAGFGNVGAGIILDYAQQWQVFIHVRELFVLIPSLLGLKGNLEMTMASRLSTQANLGHMNDSKELWRMTKGNLALVQCQATVVSFVVAIFACTVNSMTSGEQFDYNNAFILCASSLVTANVACFILGSIMILVIVCSHKINVDPDNIASPVAASLGDMTTAAMLAISAHLIYEYSLNQDVPYLAIMITLAFLALLPVWIYIARTNSYTSDVITKGWTPIVVAVLISSCGGFIFDYGKSQFSRLAVFQPVINGVGGNLVAVLASRLSTSLHRYGKPGKLAPGFKLFTSPMKAFFGSRDVNTATARSLLLMSLPAHVIYFFVIRLIQGPSSADVTSVFLGLYLIMAVMQVAILLFMAQNLVNLLWRCEIDPDNYSTPILTAMGDLLGCAFLVVVFLISAHLGDPNATTII